MKIELSNITVKQLVEQYEDNQEDGVVGFGGRLNNFLLAQEMRQKQVGIGHRGRSTKK